MPKKFPDSPGDAIDLLFGIRARREKAQAAVAVIDKEYDALEVHILSLLNTARLTSGRGRTAQATISTSVVPTLEDAEAFYKYLARTKQFDLLQKRLAVTAVRERWDEQKEVPGVGRFQKRVLHLTKVS